jgi:hypothetical protein
MKTLVVHESMWGNSRAIAEAIAAGIPGEVETVDVSEAPLRLEEVDLLVVGGPTHAFSMSRASTRRDAVTKGAPPGHERRGIREWLDAVDSDGPLTVATFDTRVSLGRIPGSASRSAARLARRRRIGTVVATQSFYVEDLAGPLVDGELDRAREWGAALPAISHVG